MHQLTMLLLTNWYHNYKLSPYCWLRIELYPFDMSMVAYSFDLNTAHLQAMTATLDLAMYHSSSNGFCQYSDTQSILGKRPVQSTLT